MPLTLNSCCPVPASAPASSRPSPYTLTAKEITKTPWDEGHVFVQEGNTENAFIRVDGGVMKVPNREGVAPYFMSRKLFCKNYADARFFQTSVQVQVWTFPELPSNLATLHPTR